MLSLRSGSCSLLGLTQHTRLQLMGDMKAGLRVHTSVMRVAGRGTVPLCFLALWVRVSRHRAGHGHGIGACSFVWRAYCGEAPVVAVFCGPRDNFVSASLSFCC